MAIDYGANLSQRVAGAVKVQWNKYSSWNSWN